jgi:hypothetical protein
MYIYIHIASKKEKEREREICIHGKVFSYSKLPLATHQSWVKSRTTCSVDMTSAVFHCWGNGKRHGREFGNM